MPAMTIAGERTNSRRPMMKQAVLVLVAALPAVATAALQPTVHARRTVLALLPASLIRPASAYDSMPTTKNADLEALEKARRAREELIQRNRKRFKPYVDAISATDADGFVEAANKFSVFLIGEGTFPEGLDAAEIRDVINDAYDALPTTPYPCEMTRTNNGICTSLKPRTQPVSQRTEHYMCVSACAQATRLVSL